MDDYCPSSYICENYDSITGDEFYGEMSSVLKGELEAEKVSLSSYPPTCVHSFDAVKKSNGKLRPITDCSRPDNHSINNYMDSTFESFSYKLVDDAVELLNQKSTCRW